MVLGLEFLSCLAILVSLWKNIESGVRITIGLNWSGLLSLDSDPCKCCGSIRSSLRKEIKMEIDLMKKFVVQTKYNSNYIQLMLE